MTPTNFSEHFEQVTVVQWARRKGLTIMSVPNEGTRSVREATQLKRRGMLPGAPDLFLINFAPTNRRPTMIEMKRKRGGVYSPEQLAIHALAKSEGWNVIAPPAGHAGQWVIQELTKLGY